MHESIDSSPHGPARVSASWTAQSRPRVLIAEDEWAFRVVLLLAFEEAGYDVVTVGNGPKLLEVLASSMLPNSGIDAFDMVVSDVRMPGWSGLLALEELCRSPLVPPVVVITAFGSHELHQRAEQAGAAAVLDKPFDLADLTALGRRMIARHAC
jgi:CheY-like chemotaxis protein